MLDNCARAVLRKLGSSGCAMGRADSDQIRLDSPLTIHKLLLSFLWTPLLYYFMEASRTGKAASVFAYSLSRDLVTSLRLWNLVAIYWRPIMVYNKVSRPPGICSLPN